MPSLSGGRGGRLAGLGRVSKGALSSGRLMEVAVMAIDRWNRLSVEEQRRFRELADRAGGPRSASLSTHEQKELRRLWKRLEVRRLLRDGIAVLALGEGRQEKDRREKPDAQPPG